MCEKTSTHAFKAVQRTNVLRAAIIICHQQEAALLRLLHVLRENRIQFHSTTQAVLKIHTSQMAEHCKAMANMLEVHPDFLYVC